MSTTPDQARELLDGATPGPWVKRRDQDGNPTPVVVSTARGDRHHIMTADPAASPARQQADTALIAAAPDLAQTIAGMTWEWGVEDAYGDTAWMVRDHYEGKQDSETEAREYLSTFGPDSDARLVRRLVGPVEVVE